MIKVAITGVAGRMGGTILSLLREEDGIKIVGATEKEGHSSIGKDIGNLAGGVEIGVQVSDRIEVAATNADAIIDFTTPAVTLSNAFYASKKGKAMVVGTTGFLDEEIAETLGRDFKKVARFERHGRIGERGKEEIGIQAIRGGDIIGEHTVIFCGTGERIEFTHRALSRDNFAMGAIRALKWVVGKPPGIYTMKDVLGIQ